MQNASTSFYANCNVPMASWQLLQVPVLQDLEKNVKAHRQFAYKKNNYKAPSKSQVVWQELCCSAILAANIDIDGSFSLFKNIPSDCRYNVTKENLVEIVVTNSFYSTQKIKKC